MSAYAIFNYNILDRSKIDELTERITPILKVISHNVLEDASLIVSRVNKKIDDKGNVVDVGLRVELEELFLKLIKLDN